MVLEVTDFRAELELLVELADSHHPAEALADIDAVLAAGARSIDDLSALFLDRDDGVARHHAGNLLARIGGDIALAAFVALLRDPRVTRRNHAVNLLNVLGLPGAIPALLDVLLADPDEGMRECATLALGSCGTSSAAALEALLTMLTDRDEGPRLRAAAAEALNGYDDARVSPALIVALDDPEPEVRFFAAFALSARRDVTALPALERLAAIEQAVIPNWGSVRDEVVSAIKSIRYAAARRLSPT